MTKYPFLVAAAAAIFIASTSITSQAQNETDLEQMSYALGVLFGSNLMQQGIEDVDPSLLAKGLQDKLNGSPTMSPDEANA